MRDTELRREIARVAPFATCNDPTHPADCDCGATPDRDYERGLDI